MHFNKRKRAASSELPTHARITYHAGPRAFERLFKERSLQELKDVVRRKLGLGSEATVKLKQMRSNALLDLDDDDDFEALRAQALRDAGSTIDIGVTVEEDQSKVPATSTAVTDGPQEMAFGDDATATTPQAVAHRTERGGEPGGEPKSKARGKKVKPPPKDTHSAAESTQGLPAQPETEADSVTATTKPNVEGEHAGEPPKKRQKRAKEKVVHPSNEPATPGAGLATGERLESIEVLKDSEASKSGRISPPTDNIRERARMAERPIDESPTEAVPPASIKKLAQPRKSKSQASRKVVLSISDRASRQKLTGSDSL
ncbi:hypothetical protein BKA83DRAFT_219217 [Pisolithus microcarpus]|nr:hypothetical protein BKA83DRAFT_219217 [Pisolithus microcarpus]